MDKQKQIEEIEKDIAVRMAMAKGVAGSMNNGVEGWLGKYLIEKGWAKIPKNTVVLKREEYDELCCSIGVSREEVDRVVDMVEKDTRKETAEKFVSLLEERCKEKAGFEYSFGNIKNIIDEICDEITEGKV